MSLGVVRCYVLLQVDFRYQELGLFACYESDCCNTSRHCDAAYYSGRYTLMNILMHFLMRRALNKRGCYNFIVIGLTTGTWGLQKFVDLSSKSRDLMCDAGFIHPLMTLAQRAAHSCARQYADATLELFRKVMGVLAPLIRRCEFLCCLTLQVLLITSVFYCIIPIPPRECVFCVCWGANSGLFCGQFALSVGICQFSAFATADPFPSVCPGVEGPTLSD